MRSPDIAQHVPMAAPYRSARIGARVRQTARHGRPEEPWVDSIATFISMSTLKYLDFMSILIDNL